MRIGTGYWTIPSIFFRLCLYGVGLACLLHNLSCVLCPLPLRGPLGKGLSSRSEEVQGKPYASSSRTLVWNFSLYLCNANEELADMHCAAKVGCIQIGE